MRQLLLTIFILSTQVYSQTLSDSLVLYLPFTGNVADSSGNGYTIANAGATLAPDRFGNANSAYYFDGSDNMTISAAQNLPNVDSSGFTASFWVKIDTATTGSGSIVSYGSIAKGGYAISYYDRIAFNVVGFTSVSRVFAANLRTNEYLEYTEISAPEWNMLTITYKDGVMKTYLNGSYFTEVVVATYPSLGYDFVLGKGVACWIDDVNIYNRALSNLEVAQLSGLSGAVKAANLCMYCYADYERNSMYPTKHSYKWHWDTYTTNTAQNDATSYMAIVENPIKAGANTSEYVGATVTFPTFVAPKAGLTSSPSRKSEYRFETENGVMTDHHHIMQWKTLLYDSSIVKMDSLYWFKPNQITGAFQLYAAPCNAENIAYNGGIFNDNNVNVEPGVFDDTENRLNFTFRYRALPDSALIYYKMDIGQWITFTYDIFWTESDSGYWRVYKDGELLSSRDNVVTLPPCSPDGASNHASFKTGQYTRWNDYIDNEIDSLVFYIDDIEMYIDPEDNGITISDICPKCDASGYTSVENQPVINQPVEFSLQQNYPNPFNPTTTIQYQVPRAYRQAGSTEYTVPASRQVVLKIYNILGQEVAMLVNEQQPAGRYKIEFDASGLSSGIYIYTLSATGGAGNGFQQSRKLLLLK